MTRLAPSRGRWALGLALAVTPAVAVAAPVARLRPLLVAAAQVDRLDAGACAPVVADELSVCLQARLRDGDRWVSGADLLAWGMPREELIARVLHRAGAHVRSSGEFVEVDGLGAYWIAATGDGWASSGLLHPDRLARLLGTDELRVAVPNIGVLLAWAGGSEDFDLAMAVGASDMFNVQKLPVSATVFRLDGRGWAPWASARER